MRITAAIRPAAGARGRAAHGRGRSRGRSGSRAGHIRAPARPRPDRHALREAGGDRGGERAAGAVGVAAVDPRALPECAVRPRSPARRTPCRRQVPALQQHRAAAQLEQRLGRALHRGEAVDRAARHRISASGRLGVSTAARGTSKRFSASIAPASISGAPPFATMTGSTTSGIAARALGKHRRDGLDHRRIVQHAGLDRVGADIVEHHLDLLADEVGRDRQDAEDALACSARSAR